MEQNNNDRKQELLRTLPELADLPEYRKQVTSMLDKTEHAFRQEKYAVRILWIVCVGLAVGFLWFDRGSAAVPKGPWLALFTFLLGAVELIRHAINGSRISLLKELKQLQLYVLETQTRPAK